MKDKAETIITTELAKQNVTEAVIAKLKKDYFPLTIKGVDDKEGYKKVHDARIVCRDHRVLAEKICKAGREDAVKEQKAWIAKEKEVVVQISEVEQHLKKQEDAIDTEKENIRIRGERLLKLPGRKEQIVGIEQYFEPDCLEDTYIMTFTDEEWSKVVLLAKEKKLAEAERKLAEQQKTIDLENEKKFIIRVNELFAAGAIAAFEEQEGGELAYAYIKGDIAITKAEVSTLSPAEWTKKIDEFFHAPDITAVKSEQTNISYKPSVTDRILPIEEKGISDEEKLFNYASALEKVIVPVMKTKEGQSTLVMAQDLLSQTINLLRE